MKKIIHFDDDELLAEVYNNKLKKDGTFDVKHFSNTPSDKNKLLELVIEERPDLIIIGILQPKMNGFKITETLKSDERTNSVPIFGLDNWTQQTEVDKLKSLGMDRYYINSQCGPDEFLKEIRDFFANR